MTLTVWLNASFLTDKLNEMKIENKEDIANFIESHLKELGGEAYGVNYVAEKLFEWYESELKN